MDPRLVRQELLCDPSADLNRRRAVVCISLLAMAGMALGALRQTGVIQSMPNPPGKMWDTDRVVTSEEAYPLGIPDAPIALTSLAINIVLASIGGRMRSKILALAASGKSAADVAVSAWYVSRMPKLRAWCPYCLFTAASNTAILALNLIELAAKPARARSTRSR